MEKNKFFEYVKKAPKHADLILKKNYKKIREKLKNFNGVVIVAAGTSYTAVKTSIGWIEELFDKPIILEYPFSFLNKNKYISNFAYIFISQSGESISILKSAKKIDEYKLCITEDEDSSLVKLCDDYVFMHDEKEKIAFKSLGFFSTICNLLNIFNFKNTKIIFDSEFLSIQKLYEHIKPIIKNINKDNFLTFIGANEGFGIAEEASIKSREMLWIHSNHFEFEDFAHGNDGYVGEKDVYIIIGDYGKNFKKMSREFSSTLKRFKAKNVYITSDLDLWRDEFSRLERLFFNMFFLQILISELNIKFERFNDKLRFRDLVRITKTYG